MELTDCVYLPNKVVSAEFDSLGDIEPPEFTYGWAGVVHVDTNGHTRT